MDYFGARYYSSAQGRFSSADTFRGLAANPQTLNLYTYVQNNPLIFTDPTGHASEGDPETRRLRNSWMDLSKHVEDMSKPRPSYSLDGWKRVPGIDSSGNAVVNYQWVNDARVHDVPNNYSFIDTSGRVIRLYGDDATNDHRWAVNATNLNWPEWSSFVEGNPPPSYVSYGNTLTALRSAGYRPLRVFGFMPDLMPAHFGGFDDISRGEYNVQHITLFTKDCCKGGVPAVSDQVVEITHRDGYSPTRRPFSHFFLKTFPIVTGSTADDSRRSRGEGGNLFGGHRW